MEMQRAGNPLRIYWNFNLRTAEDNVGVFPLEGKPLRLTLITPRGKKELTDYTVEGSVITWDFTSDYQKAYGDYSLMLEVLSPSGKVLMTADQCGFARITDKTCFSKSATSSDTITLSSELTVVRIMPVFPEIGPNGNWWVDGGDTGHSSVGTSAYEYALSLGYAGTEEDYAAEMAALPVLNEESREATGAATKAAEAATIAAKNATDAAENANNASEEASTSASQAAAAAASANEAAEKANEAAEKAEAAIEAFGAHNIGSIDLFEQIIAERRNHNLTQEDKDAILNGKIITTSAGNGVVPTISSNSIGENGAVLIFHFNERLYEMFVMWTDTLCYINGVLSFTRETKLYADSELSETSENSVQNKVITKKLTELLAENERLKERIEEQDQFIEDLQNTKIEKENDDYYPKMAVGLADNLAGFDVVDSQINFRRSGGGAISDGVARIEAIKGNSVVWNQVFKPNISAYGSQFVKTEDDGLTMEAIKEPSEKFLTLYSPYMGIASHKYFLAFDVVSGSYTEGETRMEIFGNVVQPEVPRIIALSEAKKIGATLREVGCVGMRFRVRAIDLTQMFGSGNEPTTIEEFYARIPMGVDLNAYNEVEVINMDVQSIESVGVNQWDEEWEKGSISINTGANVDKSDIIRTKNFIPVIEGRKYYYKCPSSGTAWSFCYDDKYNVVEKYLSNNRTGLASSLYNAEFTVPQGVHYIRFYVVNTYGTTYKGDICINLSDASINGKYYPHIKRVEDLSIIRKYFPQGMKSAGSAHDEIRYNMETQKWEKVVRIGEVDMGALSYLYSKVNNAEETYDVIYTFDIQDIVKLPSVQTIANILSHEYITTINFALSAKVIEDKAMMLYQNGTLYIRDTSYTDVASFKAAMQGVMLYYELAEPIVTELDEADQFKDLDYQVWNAGTEKAIAEGKSAPLAADITYGFNAIGKIKELESLVAALRAKVGI